MDEILDLVKASIIILLAVGVIAASFFAFTVVVPILLVSATIYVVAKVIKDERERY